MLRLAVLLFPILQARRAVPGAELGNGGRGTTPDHRQEVRHAVRERDRTTNNNGRCLCSGGDEHVVAVHGEGERALLG